VFWEELTTTSKLLSPTYFKIKADSMKALKFKCLKYTGENTACYMYVIEHDAYMHKTLLNLCYM
jgi:hypothetical protein